MSTAGLTSFLQAFPTSAPPPPPSTSPTLLVLPLLVGLVVLALFAVAAVRTWRRGHKLLFAVGFIVPLAWLAGAFLPPPRPGEWI